MTYYNEIADLYMCMQYVYNEVMLYIVMRASPMASIFREIFGSMLLYNIGMLRCYYRNYLVFVNKLVGECYNRKLGERRKVGENLNRVHRSEQEKKRDILGKDTFVKDNEVIFCVFFSTSSSFLSII